MKKIPPKYLLGFAVVFAASQFARPSRIPAAASGPGDLFVKYPPATEVSRLLAAACLDCHSASTRYPWYAEVQPVGWWLSGHIRNGRTALNFSALASLPASAITHQLDACVDAVNHGEMPPTSYRLLHADARLGDTEKVQLTSWFQDLADKISTGSGKK